MFASGKTAAVASAANYIEEVFSTYLYTGTGATQTITNGIDLSTKGGLVWFKSRSGAYNHALIDTARGGGQVLSSNTTSAQADYSPQGISAFNTNGFTFGTTTAELNNSSNTYASWTFRKQPKFFDVVTYTGNGQNDRQVAHNLGSTPGCVIVKCLSFTGGGGPQNWAVYHRSVSPAQSLILNTTAAAAAGDGLFGTATSTYFVVNQPGGGNTLNANGDQYVAYIFAHNAGGFGLTGTDNVISCGSFTTDGSGNATVDLGYEPQWILVKPSSTSGNWLIYDTMRGWAQTSDLALYPNLSNAELQQWSSGLTWSPTATGFQSAGWWAASQTYIYIAIRRGPMKVPTSGTSVFAPVAYTGTSVTRDITGVGFPLDMNLTMDRATHTYNVLSDRLRGLTCDGSSVQQPQLRTNTTDAEALITNGINGTSSSAMDGYTLYNAYSQMNASPDTYISYNFKRAPSFFDEVCYTGTGSATTVTHNLGVAPELMIVKNRSDAGYDWTVYNQASGATKFLYLNTTEAVGTFSAYWNNTSPTSSVFTVGTNTGVNGSGSTYVAYLFATCAGVSKVGSYTGTGTTKQVDCGFTGGARFVLIKRTDSTGDWYVWDTARGIVSGNDPYLLLNSTAAETTGTDYIDTYSAGFEISSTAPAAINASGGSFVFLAIA